MTYKEKLAIEHPERINTEYEKGDCPGDYGYAPDPEYCSVGMCKKCWNREIPRSVIQKELLEFCYSFDLSSCALECPLYTTGCNFSSMSNDALDNKYKKMLEYKKEKETKHKKGEFTLNDFKTGMLVKLKNGDLMLVYCDDYGNKKLVDEENAIELNSDAFDYNLKSKYTEEYDIEEVYGLRDVSTIYGFENLIRYTCGRKLLWKRKQIKILTYEEAKKIIGEDFKIVEEK